MIDRLEARTARPTPSSARRRAPTPASGCSTPFPASATCSGSRWRRRSATSPASVRRASSSATPAWRPPCTNPKTAPGPRRSPTPARQPCGGPPWKPPSTRGARPTVASARRRSWRAHRKKPRQVRRRAQDLDRRLARALTPQAVYARGAACLGSRNWDRVARVNWGVGRWERGLVDAEGEVLAERLVRSAGVVELAVGGDGVGHRGSVVRELAPELLELVEPLEALDDAVGFRAGDPGAHMA